MRDKGAQLLSRFSSDYAGFVLCRRKMAVRLCVFYVDAAGQEG